MDAVMRICRHSLLPFSVFSARARVVWLLFSCIDVRRAAERYKHFKKRRRTGIEVSPTCPISPPQYYMHKGYLVSNNLNEKKTPCSWLPK